MRPFWSSDAQTLPARSLAGRQDFCSRPSIHAEFVLHRRISGLRPPMSRQGSRQISAGARAAPPQLRLSEVARVGVDVLERLLTESAAMRASAVLLGKVCISASACDTLCRPARRPRPPRLTSDSRPRKTSSTSPDMWDRYSTRSAPSDRCASSPRVSSRVAPDLGWGTYCPPSAAPQRGGWRMRHRPRASSDRIRCDARVGGLAREGLHFSLRL